MGTSAIQSRTSVSYSYQSVKGPFFRRRRSIDKSKILSYLVWKRCGPGRPEGEVSVMPRLWHQLVLRSRNNSLSLERRSSCRPWVPTAKRRVNFRASFLEISRPSIWCSREQPDGIGKRPHQEPREP